MAFVIRGGAGSVAIGPCVILVGIGGVCMSIVLVGSGDGVGGICTGGVGMSLYSSAAALVLVVLVCLLYLLAVVLVLAAFALVLVVLALTHSFL